MRPIKEILEQTYDRGLENYIAGETKIAKVDGSTGKLWYRGYDIEDLAKYSTFDETSYLIIHGELPTTSQFEKWVREIESWEDPPLEAQMVLNSLPDDAHAFMLYRTMLTIAACQMPEGENTRLDAQWRRPNRLYAWSSSLASAAICRILGKEFNPPCHKGSFAANFLTRSLGREFSEAEIKAFDICLMMQAEHGCQASTLAALIVISTSADLGSAVLAGMGALSGQLHGGAIQRSFINLLQLESPEQALKWVDEKMNEGYRFPGFGHRIYKTHDPRARILETYAESLLKDTGKSNLWDLYVTVRDKIEAELGSKGIFVNIFGVTGMIYHALGLPIGSFPLVFALATQTGWMAHCLEYLADGKMIEPGAVYTG